MEINLEAISAFLENNRLTDGEKLILFNGREISFKPTGADSIGGKFLGWRSDEQQTVNNQVRDRFLRFVLKQFGAKNASQLPESVQKAMELNDYCGLFGSVSSLTARGGTSTGKPLSLRRIRAVVQAIKDCRTRAVSQLDQAIARIRELGSSTETMRGLSPASHLSVMDWTEKSVAALTAVRDVIANGSPKGEIDEAVKRLDTFASHQWQVAHQRRKDARELESRWAVDEADQYDIQADFAKSASDILKEKAEDLVDLYNVQTSKTEPRNVFRGPREFAPKRDIDMNYRTAIKMLNRFRYSGRIGGQAAKQYEFGHQMRHGLKELLLGALKKVIGLEDDPFQTADKRLSNMQVGKRQVVLTEKDFETDDVKPLRISDNQVPIPEYTEDVQGKDEVKKLRAVMAETALQVESLLERRLDEKVGQHLVKVGAMNEEELRRQLVKVKVPDIMVDAFSNLYPAPKHTRSNAAPKPTMTVLELNLVADILKDYGISIPRI